MLESEFFKENRIYSSVVMVKIWRTNLFQTHNIKELEILMLFSVKYRRQMEIKNVCVEQKYQKELWYWAVSLQKSRNCYNILWPGEAKPRACFEMLTGIFASFCKYFHKATGKKNVILNESQFHVHSQTLVCFVFVLNVFHYTFHSCEQPGRK